MKSRDIPSLIIISLFLILFLPLVSSVPPTLTNINTLEGYQIYYPQIDYMPQDSEFNLHIHISNISNGFPLTNDNATCYLHLYNSSGSHTFESPPLTLDSNGWDYEIFLSKGNFSSLGQHSFYMWCYNATSLLGGEAKGVFEVTQNGEELTTAKAVLYSMLSLVVFLIFLISLYFSVSLNYKNDRNEKGQVTKIEYGKYFKVGLILISYSLFLWFLNILVAVSDNFVNLDIFYGLISGLYLILLRGFFPVFVIVIIWIIVLAIKDINFKSLMREFNFK